jgi:Ni/Co efflux regulator RcnB
VQRTEGKPKGRGHRDEDRGLKEERTEPNRMQKYWMIVRTRNSQFTRGQRTEAARRKQGVHCSTMLDNV